MREVNYNREKAVEYAQKWAYKRNPIYLDFENIGGDCTNFVSQCIYSGAGVMNYKPIYGWFYNSPDDRAPAWTDVDLLHRFLVTNDGIGPRGKDSAINKMMLGDVIQLGTRNNDFYHSLFITKIKGEPSFENIYVTTHTFDANMRQLATYFYENIRFIHITGVWKYQ